LTSFGEFLSGAPPKPGEQGEDAGAEAQS
jgi:hypothetical protein